MINRSVNLDTGDPKTAGFPGTVESFAFPGPFGAAPEVRNAVIVNTTVESLSDSPSIKWEIAEVLAHHDGVQGGLQLIPMYIASRDKASSGVCWSLTCVDRIWMALRDVSIPNNIRELHTYCFKGCKSLRRVSFGSSSSLERIGTSCFEESGVEEVSIPDSVRQLGDCCFNMCKSLRRVTFGTSSSLEWIGVACFLGSGVEEVSIPDCVPELSDCCFSRCASLRRVTFGSSSWLERIGTRCFAECGLIQFRIPDTVGSIDSGAFGECRLPGGIICGDDCCFCAFAGLVLSHDCERCICSYGVSSFVSIPDSVRELCQGCFIWCKSLRRVIFGSSSSLERIGVSCFKWSGLEEVSIPDSVHELCDGCFRRCGSLRRVTFGSSPSLERIGVSCFKWSGLEEVSIPDSVRELCKDCFKRCSRLRRVTFGGSSSLERIGVYCFARSGVEEVNIPDSVCELCKGCFKWCLRLRRVTFGSSSSLERIGERCFIGCRLQLELPSSATRTVPSGI